MKDPAILFYTQDFLVGTMTLNYEERGKYITLLCLMHQQGRMAIETMTMVVGEISERLLNKFQQDEEGMYYNERLEIESAKRSRFVNSRRENAKKGGRPKKPKAKPIGKPLGLAKNNLRENENENEIEIEIEAEIVDLFDFESFWDMYGKKIDRKRCEDIWKKITDSNKQIIFNHVPKYVVATPEQRFRLNPLTYLRGERWNDDLINQTNKNERDNIKEIADLYGIKSRLDIQ